MAETRRAVAELAAASGLGWRYTGVSLIRPDLDKPAGVPARLAAQHLQLVISWNAKPVQPRGTQSGEPASTLRTQSGTITTSVDGVKTVTPTQLTEAAIVFDRSQEAALVAHDRSGAGLYRVLLHELGTQSGSNTSETRTR